MVGVKDMVIYSMCKDDGDGDAYGRWYTPFRVSIPPVCKRKRNDLSYFLFNALQGIFDISILET